MWPFKKNDLFNLDSLEKELGTSNNSQSGELTPSPLSESKMPDYVTDPNLSREEKAALESNTTDTIMPPGSSPDPMLFEQSQNQEIPIANTGYGEQQPVNNQVTTNNDSHKTELMAKQVEILASKIDLLKANLDTMNSKLNVIEQKLDKKLNSW